MNLPEFTAEDLTGHQVTANDIMADLPAVFVLLRGLG